MLNMLVHQMPVWIGKDFRNSKGNQIANAGLWQRIAELTAEHELLAVKGKHEYSNWMKEEMGKGERDVR